MGRPCDRSARRGRVHDIAVLRKRSEQLDAHFQSYAAIPVDRDVATAPGLLPLHGIPDQAATLRDHTREFGCAHLEPDHGERDWVVPLDRDDVGGTSAVYTISMLKIYPLCGLSRPFHPG